MKILITGTHFTPAVAVIEELKKIKGVEIVYVGRKTTKEGDKTLSVESQVLPSKGIKFIPIIAGRLQRAFTLYTIPSLLKIPIGFIQALIIILSEKPDVILSFGGYVAVPNVIIGWFFSIPIIIHEQSFVSGLANKICSVFADKIAVSFEKNANKSEKIVLTGNPIRRDIVERRDRSGRHQGLPTILILGGNQGSHVINLAIEGCIAKLTKVAYVIHVTGDNKFGDFERLEELGEEEKLGKRYVVKKWLGEEYSAILQNADLVISRAGINTLMELAYLGKSALVIPIPYLYQDEQNKNAKFFEELKLVKILPQSTLSSEVLFQNVKNTLKNIKVLREAARGAQSVIIPDAAKRLALETILLAKHE